MAAWRKEEVDAARHRVWDPRFSLLDWVLSALLDCHVLKGFGIYMIGILDSLSGTWKPITGTHRVTSTCNLSSII